MKWLKIYINNPTQRWTEFKLGLAVFVFGAGLILAGNKYWVWLQVPGLIALVIGLLFAAKGYIGMLMYRLTSGIKPIRRSPFDDDKDK